MEENGDWRQIPNCSNFFLSRNGEIYNNKLKHNVKPYLLNGYRYVKLRNDEKRYINLRLHRLMAQVFIDNPDNHPVADHIDRNKDNNDLTNLRWVTIQTNNRNRGKATGCTSQYKGVSRHTGTDKWVVRAPVHEGREKAHIGIFKSELEAGQRYNKYIIDNNLAEQYPLNVFE